MSNIEYFNVEKGKCCIDNLGDKYYFSRLMSWERCKEKVTKCNPPSRCQVTWTPINNGDSNEDQPSNNNDNGEKTNIPHLLRVQRVHIIHERK